MKTIKRYEENPYLRELDCRVLALSSYEGEPALILDETLFFPEGGGQPWDLGQVDGIPLSRVLERDGEILHLLAQPADFASGQQIHCILDWSRRFDHMQRHCGEHILSGIFDQEFGGVNRGFHMGEDEMTIDIRLEKDSQYTELTWDMALHAEWLANQAVWANLPVTARVFAQNLDVGDIPMRKETELETDIRIVTVGDLASPQDSVACCGTHPSTSGQVGLIKIYKVEHYKGMFRIYFDAGQRALSDYRAKHDLLTRLGTRYSAGALDLAEKLDAREKKTGDLRSGFWKLRQSVMAERVQQILEAAGGGSPEGSGSVPVWDYSFDDMPQEDLLSMGREIAGQLAGLLIIQHPSEKTLFLFSQGEPDCGKLIRDHLSIYKAKGGGNGTSSRIIFEKKENLALFVDLIQKHLR